MSAEELLEHLMNAPSFTALIIAAVVAGALLLLAGGLLGFTRWSGLGIGLGVVGLLGAVAVLALVDAQTDISHEGPNVTVARSRFGPQPRAAARAALVVLPIGVTVTALVLWAARARRLRARLPSLIKSGRAHLLQDHPALALADFEQAVQIAPRLGEAYSGRGCALYAMGEAERALADFNRAVEYDSRQAVAYLQRGKLHTEMGAFDAALEDFQRLLNLRGPDPESHLNRGICLYKQGRSDEAARDFQRVLKLTNHSDFAEPAREWLRQIVPVLDGAPAPSLSEAAASTGREPLPPAHGPSNNGPSLPLPPPA